MTDLDAKTVLVTGGTGFIGAALLPALQAQGAAVIVLTRRQPRQGLAGIRYITALSQLGTQKIDVIVNLAGAPIARRWTAAARKEIWDSRIVTTTMLVGYLAAAVEKPALLISGSAIGYYGVEADQVFGEETPPAGGSPFAQGLCAAWEAEAMKAAAFGVRTVVLRIGAVLGAGGGMLGKMLPAFRLGLGGPIGDGRQWLSWIDRDDLVRLMLHIIATPSLHGPVNATAPEPVTNAAFTKALGNALYRPALLPVPGFALRTVFGDMADEIMLQGQKVLPKKALASGFAFRSPGLYTALRNILHPKKDKR